MFFILILTLLFNFSFSQIWVQNGNFSKAFVDGKVSKDFDLFRIYNSFTSTKGIFGYNWGSNFETKLEFIAGVISIEETPGGRKVLYIPKDKGSFDKIIEKVAIGSTEEKQSKDFCKKLKKELKNNLQLFITLAKKSNIKAKLKKGTVLVSFGEDRGKVKVLSSGYIRKTNEGYLQEFNKDGLLVKMKKDNISFRYTYDYKNRLKKVITSKGDTIKFIHNDSGFVTKVIFPGNRVSSYEYDKKGNLIESIDVKSDKYTYKYDSRHKMINLFYHDKNSKKVKKWTLKYDAKTGRVTYQEDPRGFKTYLEYIKTENDKGTYKSVEVIKRKGSSVSSELYEYWRRKREDGTLYTYKIKEKKKGYTREVTYNKYQKPIIFNTNGKVTYYKYDGPRLKEKIFPDGRVIKLKYDKKDRITTLKNNKEIFKFKYNDKNQITYAENEGLKFKIYYNSKNKISKIIDNKKHNFTFSYDNKGNLNKISSLRYGSILINNSKDHEKKFNYLGKTKENSKKIRKLYKRYMDVLMIFTLIGRI
jgi:YD repeat-containing protein